MSIRVGESWTARNGHRRWVSMGLGDYLLGLGSLGILGLLVFPFLLLWWLLLAELWLLAEAVLLALTTVLVTVALVRREARIGDVKVTVLRWHLFILDLAGT